MVWETKIQVTLKDIRTSSGTPLFEDDVKFDEFISTLGDEQVKNLIFLTEIYKNIITDINEFLKTKNDKAFNRFMMRKLESK